MTRTQYVSTHGKNVRAWTSELWFIREKYLSLLADLSMKEKPLEQLQTQRDALLEELHGVYSGSPSTTFQAYRKAQEALQRQEELTFSDAEIDAFLPGELRRTGKGTSG